MLFLKIIYIEDKDIDEFMEYFVVMLAHAQTQERDMLFRWQDEFIKR